MQKIRFIDSHTGGEPTRLILEGGPDLGSGPLDKRREIFKRDFDHYRSAMVNEPRGSDVVVGGLLCDPYDSTCAVGILFFNNVGMLGMCGHGTIGLIATLAYMGRIQPGVHRIDTPVGVVTATLHPDGRVSVQNIPSYRKGTHIEVDVPGEGRIVGDVAWGGNWFFLVAHHGEEIGPHNLDRLTELSWKIRQAINAQGYPEVDHVELFGPPSSSAADSRNFVLCPGKAYDRSPCGTGTSAKLACLYADGKLVEGQVWRQESVIGSIFEGSVQLQGDQLIPTITGRAHISVEGHLILDPADPFCWGIRA